MDPNRFDRFTRALGSGKSRRVILKSLAGGVAAAALAAAGIGDAAATTRKRSIGNSCNINGDCITNLCVQESPGRRICHQCTGPSDCPAGPDVCHSAVCSPYGSCGLSINVNKKCDDGNACTTGDVCQANGTCAGTPFVCQALDQCHLAGSCDPGTGICSNPIAPDATACSGGLCCDGTCLAGNCCRNSDCSSSAPVCSANACVQCNTISDCPAPSDPCTQATCTANVCGTAAVADDQTGACPSGQACCGGSCTDRSNNANHCGHCATKCGSPDACSGGVCAGAGTCAAGTDFCFTGVATSCNGSSSCYCHTKVNGGMFCGGGNNGCGDCNADADCAGFGAGWACLELGTHCSVCFSNTPTHVCMAPCST